jgi:hypothetical protein
MGEKREAGVVTRARGSAWVSGSAGDELRPAGWVAWDAGLAPREPLWRLWWRGWTSWAAAFVNGGGTR